MSGLRYADRQILQKLQEQPFTLGANTRWYFAEGRSIADTVARRLVAVGEARVIGSQLFKRPVAHGTRQQPEGER